jgi:hypothetical protein
MLGDGSTRGGRGPWNRDRRIDNAKRWAGRIGEDAGIEGRVRGREAEAYRLALRR